MGKREIIDILWDCTTCTIHTHILIFSDEYESEGTDTSDEESHPFTRAELQNKVMKTVKRRESAIRRDGFKYDLSNAREKTQKQKGKK